MRAYKAGRRKVKPTMKTILADIEDPPRPRYEFENITESRRGATIVTDMPEATRPRRGDIEYDAHKRREFDARIAAMGLPSDTNTGNVQLDDHVLQKLTQLSSVCGLTVPQVIEDLYKFGASALVEDIIDVLKEYRERL
jgi:hypothetical protein